jgi:TatD DNase family protein
MELFETHFHYYGHLSPEDYYRDLCGSQPAWLLAAGADYEESRTAKRFADTFDNAWFSAGVHPHSAANYPDGIKKFDCFTGDPKLVAIGEIGLDYFYEHSDRSSQQKVFEQFLAHALDVNLPAIVHCRDQDDSEDAYNDAYPLLKDFAAAGGSFELHCYAGTPVWAEKFLALGAYLGITGIVTFPKAENIRENLRVIPLDRLLLETDSPYLAPKPFRGKKNNPGYLIHVAEKCAEVLGLPLASLAAATTGNAFNFFRITRP